VGGTLIALAAVAVPGRSGSAAGASAPVGPARPAVVPAGPSAGAPTDVLAGAVAVVAADGSPAETTVPAPATTIAETTEVAPCRVAVLVHGGGYFMGDAGALEASLAVPLRDRGYDVRNVDYPMLPDWPDVEYDDADPWYPRPDVDSTPPALRTVHDRAVRALAPTVAEALATGCRVTLVGVSAGGSIVADLAHEFPAVAEAVLVVGASITPDRMGGAPLAIYYGTADEVVLPGASVATCERWRAAGGACELHAFVGSGHLSPEPPTAALARLVAAATAGRP
jgi:acetyl esterase/lipase